LTLSHSKTEISSGLSLVPPGLLGMLAIPSNMSIWWCIPIWPVSCPLLPLERPPDAAHHGVTILNKPPINISGPHFSYQLTSVNSIVFSTIALLSMPAAKFPDHDIVQQPLQPTNCPIKIPIIPVYPT